MDFFFEQAGRVQMMDHYDVCQRSFLPSNLEDTQKLRFVNFFLPNLSNDSSARPDESLGCSIDRDFVEFVQNALPENVGDL